MKEHEKDHLAEIKDIDESSVEELAEMYPMLGKSAKQRILEKCLEKTDEAEFQEGITVSGTEIYKRPMWSRILSAAAALVCVSAVAGGAVLLKRNRLSYIPHQSTGETSQSALTTTAEVTEKITASTTTSDAVTTTTSTAIVAVETSEYIVYTTAPDFAESTTTTETTTTEVTTTDVTTTDDEENQETSETTAEITSDFLAGSWNAEGGVGGRVFEFYSDGSSGKYNMNESGLGLPFAYDLSNGTITFHFGAADTDPESGAIDCTGENSFIIRWEDGNTEIFTRIG